MLHSIGIPTWFLTLSAADLHWPEMIQAVAMQYGKKLSRRDVLKMSMQERSKYLHQNPVTGVRMFQHRLESFFSQYLLSDAHPIGHITDYVIKIEFQMRGSPHAHCLLWVSDAPRIDQDSDEVVCEFIDKYISASPPIITDRNIHDINLRRTLQKHIHADNCRRNNTCRFGFPKPPSTKTIIMRPPSNENKEEVITNSKDILQKVQRFISNNDITQGMSLETILQNINVNLNEYTEALKVSHKGTNIILKRNVEDVFTNACNIDILSLWGGGNMDLQPVVDDVGAVMYVCSYMTKGEKFMGETLKRVSKECKNDDIHTQMNKIKKEFLGKRVFGTPESAMRILSMWLMKKSRKVTCLNTEMKEQRVSLPKSQEQLSQLSDDDENVFATSIIDRYSARPQKLKLMCLAQFAVNYEPLSSCKNETFEVGIDTEYNQHDTNNKDSYMENIKLNNGLGTMRKRKREAILQTRRYKVHSEPEKYYHSKLLLYYPWCNEEELISGFDTYQNSYISKQEVINENSQHFNDDCEIFDLSEQDFENNLPQSAWDLTSPCIAQEDGITLDQGFTTIQKLTEEKLPDTDIALDCNNTEKHHDFLLKLYSKAANREHISFTEYCKQIRSLNDEQRHIVMFNRQWCKNYVHAVRQNRTIDGY